MNSKIWNGDLGDSYSNPILYGDYSDPDVCRAGEDYFMISSSFCNAPGLPLLHSKDLVNWKVVNYILPRIPDSRYDKPVHGCGVWAPAIRCHEGTFYACFPMPDEGIFMSTARDPFGKWSEPVNIRPGAGWIDPCPFWDDDGRAWLVAGVAKSRIGYKSVLYMVEMQPDGMELIGEEVKIFDGNENGQVTIEGPKLYKRNGWYYIFAPAGGVKTGWQTVLRSRNILGPYEFRVVMRQGSTSVNGPHQGAWVDTVTGEDWFLHFQDVYAAGRIVHLQPMSWKEDWPVIGIAEPGAEWGEPVLQYRKPDVGAAADRTAVCEPDTSDDFTGSTLGLQWQWNANPGEGWYRLTGDGLRLYAVQEEAGLAYGDYPNLLLQKWPAPEFSCVTRMELSGLCEGDEAGVISMGMEYGALVFAKAGTGFSVHFVTGKQQYGRILAERTAETRAAVGFVGAESFTGAGNGPEAADRGNTAEVLVRYTVKRVGTQDLSASEKGFPLETVLLEYSTDGVSFVKAGELTAVPGRWVGVKNGVFCGRKSFVADRGAEKRIGFLEVKSVIYSRGESR